MKIKPIYFIIAAFTIMVASCKKDLTKANTNPDQVIASEYNPNLLLTTVELSYTGSTNFGGSVWGTKWAAVSMFMQHCASWDGFYYGDKYLNNLGAMGEMMADQYTSAVQPAVELYHLTANVKQYRNLHQMARIMKAMIFEQITDQYGDIPYFQAGLGHFDDIYTPVYDKQQDIYTDLLKEVSEATDSLTESGDLPTGDALYYGNGSDQIAQWKKLGYSLQLRMAMRLTKVAPDIAQQYAVKVAGKTFTSNVDNAIVQHQDGLAVTQNRDALQLFGNDTTGFRLSSTYVSNMKKNNDPRLAVISWLFLADVDGDGDVIDTHPNDNPKVALGCPNGYILGGTNPATDLTKLDTFPTVRGRAGVAGYSTINDNILYTSAPDLILTYSETELLFADAANRWPSLAAKIGTAQSHFNNGVIAAITQLSAFGDAATISEADAETYLTAHAYLGDNPSGLAQINMQYWLCTLMDEYECFANWRRCGDLPHLTPVNYPGNGTGGTIPRRLTYPPSEKITNAANYNKAVSNLTGGDKMTSRVWWDVKQ